MLNSSELNDFKFTDFPTFLEKIIIAKNPKELVLRPSLFGLLNDQIFNNYRDEKGNYPRGKKTASEFTFGNTKIKLGEKNSEIVDEYLLNIFEFYFLDFKEVKL